MCIRDSPADGGTWRTKAEPSAVTGQVGVRPDQHPEADGVDEAHVPKIEHDARVAGEQQPLDLMVEHGRCVRIELAGHLHDDAHVFMGDVDAKRSD